MPLLEQQLLGLVWRGGKIDHPAAEHDDWANACTAVAVLVLERPRALQIYAGACGSTVPTAVGQQSSPMQERFLRGE